MVERFVETGEDLLAVLSNGEVYVAPLATLAWRRIPDVTGVAAATTVAIP